MDGLGLPSMALDTRFPAGMTTIAHLYTTMSAPHQNTD